jgi:hypothetical protein
MSLLARDHRLPHLFYLRAERPVYRYGIVALAIAAALLMIAVNADTNRLIPLFTIGVFMGFTISQVGLVRHWSTARPPRWRLRVAINGVGAVMTAVAVVVFVGSKFLNGAWVVVIVIPLLMLLFWQTERYYAEVASELELGETPELPHARRSIVIVPTTTISLLTERALSAALSLGETVTAIAVAGDDEESARITHDWARWRCAVPLEVLLDPHRSLVRTVLRYVESIAGEDATITVLIPQIIPSKRRHEVLHNQRGRILATVLRSQTNVVVATFPFRLHE